MANNPLYPGYQPGKKNDENINPLYPGYYAGQPLQRRPSPKNYLRPIEYEGDKIAQALDETEQGVLKTMNVPKWIIERVADDWKSKYKISIKPPDIETTELDDYATEDFPGAVTTLNVDPGSWKKDAKKEAVKTIKSWVKESTGFDTDNPLKTDFSDIENKVNHELWIRALGYGKPDTWLEEKTSMGVAKRVAAPFPNLSENLQKGENPLNVRDVAVWYVDDNGNKVVKKDIYHNTAAAAAEFAEQSSNPKVRDKLHSQFIANAISATNTEIQAKFRNPGIKDRSFLDKYEGDVKLFDIKTQTIDDIRNLQEKTLKGTTKEIKKSILKGAKRDSYASTWEELEIALNKASNNQKTRMKNAETLLSQGKISKEAFDKLQKSVNDYNSFLDNALDKVTGAKDGKLSPTIVLHSLTGVGEKSLVEENLFTKSIVGKLQKDAEYSMISTKPGEIGRMLRDDNLKAQGMSFSAEKISAVAYRLRREKIGQQTTEFLEAVNDPKKALERYAWNRVTSRMSPRLAAFTTGEYIENRLKKRNYFGLKVDESGIPSTLSGSKRAVRKFERFERKYGYKVDIKLEKKYFGVGKLTVRGGDQFKILNNKLLKGLDSEIDKEFLLHTLGDGKVTADMLSKKFFGKTFKDLTGGEKKEIAAFARESRAYREWVNSLSDKFGDKTKQGLFGYELFKRVKGKNDELPNGYSLTRKYAGRLEKVHKKMLEAKAKFEKSAIGKLIKIASNWREMAAEKIAELVSKLVAKLIGAVAGSTGIFAVLGPIIEKVVNFVVKEVVKRVTDFFSAVVKGDIDKAFEVLEEAAKKFALGCSLIFAPFFAAIISIVLLLGSILGGSESPIDRTADSTLIKSQTEFVSGENAVVKITKGATVKVLGTGETITNPNHFENSVLRSGLQVTYKVHVTPKITLPNGSVFFIDEVLARNEMDSWSVKNYGTTMVNPFIAGNTITYDLTPPIIIKGDKFKDSVVANTATAYTPEVEDVAEAESASAVRSFSIGDAMSDVQGCEGYDVGILPARDPNANRVAQRAYDIASGLERGFWCDFNQSHDYPQLWDSGWWAQYGAWGLDVEKASTEGAYKLFWCTWLVIKSYQETTDENFPVATYVPNMKKFFEENTAKGYSYTPRDAITIDEIQSGDVLFFKGHVAIIYSKTSDSVTTVESNNIKLSVPITTAEDGHLPGSLGRLEIIGIGHKR